MTTNVNTSVAGQRGGAVNVTQDTTTPSTTNAPSVSAIQTLGLQNATAVQSMINTAVATAVATVVAQLTTRPAVNVVFADGTVLEPWRQSIIQQLQGPSPTAPSVTSAPTIATTTGTDGAVGSIMTATTGSTSGTVSQTLWLWSRVNATTPATGISGATFSTYTRTAADFNAGGTPYHLVVNERVQGPTGLTSPNGMTSAQSSVTTAAAPTNSGAPSISGSAVAGSTLTGSAGTWTGATLYAFQFYSAGVPLGARTTPSASTTATIVSTNPEVGLAITLDVIAYSSLNVPSAAVAGSNSITVTGATPAIANTTPPLWPTTINFGTQAVITPGVWTGSINATRSYSFYDGSTSNAPYAGPQSLPLHTPRSPAVVGDTLYSIETVYDAATGLTAVGSAASAGKVISAALSTLAVSLTTEGSSAYSWTQSSAITQANPATIANGTSPYFVSFSPALPPGLTGSVSGSNVVISGTPTATSASTSYVGTVTDSASGTPVTFTINAVVAAASGGATPLASAPLPTGTQINYYPGNWDGSTSIVCSDPNRTTALSVVKDPLGSASVNLHVSSTDFSGAPLFGGARVELTREQLVLNVGVEYWFGVAANLDNSTGVTNDSAFIIFQTHTRLSGDTTPDTSIWYWPKFNIIYIGGAYATAAPSGVNAGPSTVVDYWGSASGGPTKTMPAYNTWTKFIIRKVPGYTTAHGPLVQIWMSLAGAPYVQIVNDTNFNTYNVTGSGLSQSYPRNGSYYFQTDDSSQWPMPSPLLRLWMPDLFIQQGSNLYSNAVAALAPYGNGL